MSDKLRNEELHLDDTVKVNKDGRPILGRLSGPCADFISSTRNGRKYDESLWEKVFNDPIVKEYFECGGIPGELDHPADRTETCSEKIAIMMPEPPQKDGDGHLIATFDILDTPNGRIAYTLARYGYKLGISSRGSGDTYTGSDGDEHVDEDSYDFQAFDLVLLPAVKAARLEFESMSESFNTRKDDFKRAINESLKKSTAEEQRVMMETLNSLGIYSSNRVNIDSKALNHVDADNVRASLVKDLQESVKTQRLLEQKIAKLQEKLSVCYAKEAKFEDIESKNKSLAGKVRSYEKLIKSQKEKIAVLSESISEHKGNSNSLNESLSTSRIESSRLKESIEMKNNKILNLISEANSLKESIALKDGRIDSLQESIEELKSDAVIKNSQYASNLSKSKQLIEKYKKIANRAVEKYVALQAKGIGVSADEIKSRLSESYSFDDIDRVCEGLKSYRLNMSKLPFNVENAKTVKMKVTESKKPSIIDNNVDDNVDDDFLKSLAKL